MRPTSRATLPGRGAWARFRANCATRLRTAALDFRGELARQRLDDHRHYHHSRINQSLHLVSGAGFIVSYGLLIVDPAAAALLAWSFSMTTRQAGHFFFEPRGYDFVNQVTDEYKERIKVGYNIRRKVVLMAVWLAVPIVLWFVPSLRASHDPFRPMNGFVNDVGVAWLALGMAGLLFRGCHLIWRDGACTGLAWMAKVVTDPFHDIALYRAAPLALARGQRIDPMERLRRS